MLNTQGQFFIPSLITPKSQRPRSLPLISSIISNYPTMGIFRKLKHFILPWNRFFLAATITENSEFTWNAFISSQHGWCGEDHAGGHRERGGSEGTELYYQCCGPKTLGSGCLRLGVCEHGFVQVQDHLYWWRERLVCWIGAMLVVLLQIVPFVSTWLDFHTTNRPCYDYVKWL